MDSEDGFQTVTSKRNRRDRNKSTKTTASSIAKAAEQPQFLDPILSRGQDPVDRPVIYLNRHDFRRPLSFDCIMDDDIMAEDAAEALTAYNNLTLERHTNPLEISVIKCSERRTPKCIRLFAVGRLAHDGRPGFMARLPLFYTPTVDRGVELMVQNSRTSMAFTTWLAQLPQVSDLRLKGALGYQLQYQWWQDRGTPFNYNGLPDELQDLILFYTIGEARDAYYTPLWPDERMPDHLFNHYLKYPTDKWQHPLQDATLLRLSRSANIRVRYIIEHWIVIHFTDSVDLCAVLYYMPKSTVTSALCRLQLEFSDFNYLELLQAHLPNYTFTGYSYRGGTNPQVNPFTLMPRLRYLELGFESPLDPLRDCPLPNSSPCQVGHWDHDGFPASDQATLPCRAAMIDWIMRFGFRFIKHSRRVNMTGYVKTATRTKWLHILQDRAHHDEHQARINREIEGMQNSNTLLKSTCPTPCMYRPLLDAAKGGATKRQITQIVKDYRFDFDDDFPRIHEEGTLADKASRSFREGDHYLIFISEFLDHAKDGSSYNQWYADPRRYGDAR